MKGGGHMSNKGKIWMKAAAGVLSVLTSIAGLPEVNQAKDE